jgi:hypothetical protein
MLALKKVPYVLRQGHMYKSFLKEADGNTDAEIPVPENLVKDDFSVKDMASFVENLNIISYWQIYKMPVEMLVYSLIHKDEIIFTLKDETTPHIQVYVKDLSSILIRYKNEIVDYLRANKENAGELKTELNRTLNYTIVPKLRKSTRVLYVKNVDEKKYSLIDNEKLDMVFTCNIELIRQSMCYKAFVLYKNNSGLAGPKFPNFTIVRHFIEILESWPIKLNTKYFHSYKNHINVDGIGNFYITQYNKESLIMSLKSAYEKVKNSIIDFLPVKVYHNRRNILLSAIAPTFVYVLDENLINELSYDIYDDFSSLENYYYSLLLNS